MTFTEIVAEICERCDYTSDDAFTRVGRLVNLCYRRVTTSINLNPSRAEYANPALTVVGQGYVTFIGMEKVKRVYRTSDSGAKVFLDEITIDELQDMASPVEGTPRFWAVKNITATTVVVALDALPGTVYTLYADGSDTQELLSGMMAPKFPESFHDVLIEGVLKDEYKKLHKRDLAADSKNEYENRMSDLRMWIVKSAYLKIKQGQRNVRRLPANRVER